jgi:hypothetical protein
VVAQEMAPSCDPNRPPSSSGPRCWVSRCRWCGTCGRLDGWESARLRSTRWSSRPQPGGGDGRLYDRREWQAAEILPGADDNPRAGAGGSSVRLRSEGGLRDMSRLARDPTSLLTRRPSSVAYPSRAYGWQTSGRLLREHPGIGWLPAVLVGGLLILYAAPARSLGAATSWGVVPRHPRYGLSGSLLPTSPCPCPSSAGQILRVPPRDKPEPPVAMAGQTG